MPGQAGRATTAGCGGRRVLFTCVREKRDATHERAVTPHPPPLLSQTVEGGVTVVQDVPVRVLSAADLSRYSEPAVPNPLVSARVALPPLTMSRRA